MSKNPHEKVPLSALMVEKRSGNSEKFDEEKLVSGLVGLLRVPTCQRYFKINH
jgi:transcriptional regulator NrdR family protein